MSRFALLLLLAFSHPGFAQKTLLDSLYGQAYDLSAQGDLAASTAFLVEANKLAEQANKLPALCKIQALMGRNAIMSENNEAAEHAQTQAEKYCSACKDTSALARTFLQKGVLSIKKGNNKLAIEQFKKSSAYYLLAKDTMGSANALAKIGNVLERSGDFEQAQVYYQSFYDAARKNPESAQHLTANIYLTGSALFLNQTKKALFHNDLVLAQAQKMGANFEYAQARRYDAMIHAQMGNYEKAYHKMYAYLQYYQDTLMNQQNLQQSEELKARYEAEKKEAQIALQEAELGRERLRFWVAVGGLGLAVVVGALLFGLARRLRKRNEEKEFLIKEIHHRVKNNLQILSSLLHLQSRQITNDAALDAVREGQNRVDAMGLIHQKLYMGDNLAQVEMKEYLEGLGITLLDTFGIHDGRIALHYDLQPMRIDVDTAIPLGLIINELLTNALKYAFPDERPGRITISLWHDDKKQLCLKVADDGVGPSAAPADGKSTSFGARLVQMLSKKLNGKPEVLAQEKGYATQIVFEKS